VPPPTLQQFLADLPQVGNLIKDRGYRQIWRFDFEGHGYYLKFYPRRGFDFRRLFRGSPARREFSRLLRLQKAHVPAPRAVAELSGFRLGNRIGDAVILEAIEPALPLDQYLSELARQGETIPNRLQLARKIRQMLSQLSQAGLGHSDLHLGNMLFRYGEVFLLDGYSLTLRGLQMEDLQKLAHSAAGFATRTELLRGWEELGPGGPPPIYNPVSARHWRKLLRNTRQENHYFGRIRFGPWSGIFFKRYKYPRRWAPASDLRVTSDDWQTAWPPIWRALEAAELTPLKRGPSGDVWAGDLTLGGRRLPVVIKRPFKRRWYRYLNEIGRGSRAWRAWHKAWAMIVRDIPTAWPLLVLQKRQFGYVTDSVIVFERIEGQTLDSFNLDSLSPRNRELLFRRTGGMLRKIDQLGMAHFDAKSTNWIVQPDEKLGPRPILIDVDGLRFRRWQALGLQRLLRAMRQHPQYTPADSLALCQGYAPFSHVATEE
jgi:tRNA A-37 threonylcarbamoyl transferase component Bud32